jgi:uncharacterized protein (DUF58 family)
LTGHRPLQSPVLVGRDDLLALADRRRTVARLRGLGAVVVDAPPGRLAPELADAYLRVKATGRL